MRGFKDENDKFHPTETSTSAIHASDIESNNLKTKEPDFNAHIKALKHHQKIENKASRMEERAGNLREDAKQKQDYNESLAGAMAGSPILIGHHSENRHRNALEKMHNRERKAIEQKQYAGELEKRAEGKRDPYAVSADDPDAVIKLKNRVTDFEKEKAELKAKLPNAPEGSNFTDGTKSNLKMYISSLTTNIRNTKKRIDELQTQQAKPDYDQTINGVRIMVDKEENRLKIFFPDIPSPEIRQKLKSRGFHWSPRNKAWQRMPSNQAEYLAEEIAKEHH